MILHIDMDAFFASVEQLDNPGLKGKCVVVGGKSDRGVVAAASYVARTFGIHSAMPIFMAKQKCRQLVIVPPRKARYKEVSRKVMAILKTVSPLVEQVSIDEAYVDVHGCEKLFGSAERIAVGIKSRIKKEVGLTCSVGIAPVKFLAKIASDMDKPDGLTIIAKAHMSAFIHSLPVRKVPGVGKSALYQLEKHGIRTLGDVKKGSARVIDKKFGKLGRRLLDLASGHDTSRVIPFTSAKSVSSEQTLHQDTMDRTVLEQHIFIHSREVGRQLRKHNIRAKTITLKIKTYDFKQITRSRTLQDPTNASEAVYREAKRIFDSYGLKKKVRLIGVGASNLLPVSAPVQAGLFENGVKSDSDWEKLDSVVDTISDKFGKNIIKMGYPFTGLK